MILRNYTFFTANIKKLDVTLGVNAITLIDISTKKKKIVVAKIRKL